MGLLSLFSDLLSADYSGTESTASDSVVINPTTGLPMISNSHGGIDVGGNAYCQFRSDAHSFGMDTMAGGIGCGSSFDDNIGIGSSSLGSGLDDW